MKHRAALAATLALCLLPLPGHTQLHTRAGAIGGQAADAGITLLGVLELGATELNPLGVAGAFVAKGAALAYIETLPEPDKPLGYAMLGAFGWGATASNACMILVMFTPPLAPLWPACFGAGYLTGRHLFRENEPARNRATFDAMCTAAQGENPAMVCTYTEPIRPPPPERDQHQYQQNGEIGS